MIDQTEFCCGYRRKLRGAIKDGCTYCIDGTLVLSLGFLDFGRAAHVGPRFIHLKEGAEFAYAVDHPVFAKCLEFLHA